MDKETLATMVALAVSVANAIWSAWQERKLRQHTKAINGQMGAGKETRKP